MTLYRFTSVVPHDLFTIKHVVTDVDARRNERIRSACENKFPKLDAWRRDAGARTVLVLEDNDIFLSNPERIFAALTSAEKIAPNPPDEVYVVGTFVSPAWFVWALRVGEQGYYELCNAKRGLTEFDCRDLANVLPARRAA